MEWQPYMSDGQGQAEPTISHAPTTVTGRYRRSAVFRNLAVRLLMAAILLWPAVVPAALTSATGTVLYDGSMGTTPDAQGWFYQATGTQATQSADGAVTLLDTSAVIGDQAGYSLFSPFGPVLNRGIGFTVSFQVKVLGESHATPDRAGFSVIVISSDRKGIEVAFWEGEIWVQSDTPLFTHAEGKAFNATQSIVQYELALYADTYNLSANGTTILQGLLRDYSAHEHPVYSFPNILFFGDDTTSASAAINLKSISHLGYAKTINGDIDNNRLVGLSDAVLALQANAGIDPTGIPPNYSESGADVDGNGTIGMAEAVFIFQVLAGQR